MHVRDREPRRLRERRPERRLDDRRRRVLGHGRVPPEGRRHDRLPRRADLQRRQGSHRRSGRGGLRRGARRRRRRRRRPSDRRRGGRRESSSGSASSTSTTGCGLTESLKAKLNEAEAAMQRTTTRRPAKAAEERERDWAYWYYWYVDEAAGEHAPERGRFLTAIRPARRGASSAGGRVECRVQTPGRGGASSAEPRTLSSRPDPKPKAQGVGARPGTWG